MTFAITFTSVINCVPYAIRHYAHNCLRRDKNKLLAGVFIHRDTWFRSSPIIDCTYSASANTISPDV